MPTWSMMSLGTEQPCSKNIREIYSLLALLYGMNPKDVIGMEAHS